MRESLPRRNIQTREADPEKEGALIEREVLDWPGVSERSGTSTATALPIFRFPGKSGTP